MIAIYGTPALLDGDLLRVEVCPNWDGIQCGCAFLGNIQVITRPKTDGRGDFIKDDAGHVEYETVTLRDPDSFNHSHYVETPSVAGLDEAGITNTVQGILTRGTAKFTPLVIDFSKFTGQDAAAVAELAKG